jgi:hypothetical protein
VCVCVCACVCVCVCVCACVCACAYIHSHTRTYRWRSRQLSPHRLPGYRDKRDLQALLNRGKGLKSAKADARNPKMPPRLAFLPPVRPDLPPPLVTLLCFLPRRWCGGVYGGVCGGVCGTPSCLHSHALQDFNIVLLRGILLPIMVLLTLLSRGLLLVS